MKELEQTVKKNLEQSPNLSTITNAMYEWLIPLYDLGFIFASLFFLIKYSFRKRIDRDLLKRFFLVKELKSFSKSLKRPIWLHGVSVGEIASLREVVEKLAETYPEYPLLLSTVTPQGRELAYKLYKDKAFIFYLPLDLSFIMKRAVRLINPKIFLGVETEIWPNLFFFLNKKNIPIILLNGRISKKSYKFYKISKFFSKFLLRKISFIAAQDETSKERFIEIGVDSNLIKVTGNMKFRSINIDSLKLSQFKRRWQDIVKGESILFLAGSTHSPEEEILIDVYKNILKDFKKINLLICPRHIERALKVSRIGESFGFKPILISRFSSKEKLNSQEKNIFILDTIGELIYFYSLADIVFIGGSLAKYGGHNILEPAYFSKPIIFGKYMFNFQEIKRVFVEGKACIEIKDKEELLEALFKLIKDKNLREDLGRRAKDIIDNSKDSIEENLKIIKNFLS